MNAMLTIENKNIYSTLAVSFSCNRNFYKHQKLSMLQLLHRVFMLNHLQQCSDNIECRTENWWKIFTKYGCYETLSLPVIEMMMKINDIEPLNT